MDGTGFLADLRASKFGGRILGPKDAGYDISLKRWSATAERQAAAIAKPVTAEDVSLAVTLAQQHNLTLAVRCGGHAYGGASSTDGVVVDLTLLREVSVDSSNMTVTFGGGCLGSNVDQQLAPLGLATITGLVNHVGLGGLILGGGIGMLTALHGMAIDNLLGVQIVLADGSIVEASHGDKEDLFWAIRGAGAQFGVVTRFTMRVHKQSRVWSGVLLFASSSLSKLLEAANELFTAGNRDGHCLQIIIGNSPDGQERVLRVLPLYHGSETEGRKYFSRVLDAGPLQDQTAMMTMAEVNSIYAPVVKHGLRRVTGSGSMVMPLDVGAVQRIAEKYWAFFDAHPRAAMQSVLILKFAPQHKVLEVPQDATAFCNRGDFHETITSLGWKAEELDQEVATLNENLCRQVMDTLGFDRLPEVHGGAPVGRYANLEHAIPNPADVFGVNLPRLQTLKRKYDPENVFRNWHSIL